MLAVLPKRFSRLILLFDGTRNDPQDRTTIDRLARNIHEDDDHGIRQRFFYEPGIGTRQWERLTGGIFGVGLSRNLQKGYAGLVRHYLNDLQIFVFGFSRGAYTSCSLVGMIRKCGLLKVSTPCLVEEAEPLRSPPRNSYAEFMKGAYCWYCSPSCGRDWPAS